MEPNRTKDQLRRAQYLFQQRFQADGEIAVLAPGRVNLMGEHVDYNDGFVLPMAIERATLMVARAVPEAGINRIWSEKTGEEVRLESRGSLSKVDGWARYLSGVLEEFEAVGCEVPSFEAVVISDISMGAGLSSSAALTVSFATLCEALTQRSLEPREKAHLSRRAEHRAGVPCGIMDPFASVLGQAGHGLLLDCQSEQFKLIPLEPREVAIMITDSGVCHDLADGEYAIRRQQCEAALAKLQKPSWRDVTLVDLKANGDVLSRVERMRGHHIVGEIERTRNVAEALEKHEWRRAGELMGEGHRSLRNDFEVSCDELDALVQITESIGMKGGVFGSRMTGGGFGGCIVSLISPDRKEPIMESLHQEYFARTGLRASSFVSRPAQGARVLRNLV